SADRSGWLADAKMDAGDRTRCAGKIYKLAGCERLKTFLLNEPDIHVARAKAAQHVIAVGVRCGARFAITERDAPRVQHAGIARASVFDFKLPRSVGVLTVESGEQSFGLE